MHIFRYTAIYLRYNVDVLDKEDNVCLSYLAGSSVDIVNWGKPSYDLTLDLSLNVSHTNKRLFPEYMAKYGCDNNSTVTARIVHNVRYIEGHPVLKVPASYLTAGNTKGVGYRPGSGNSIYTLRG